MPGAKFFSLGARAVSGEFHVPWFLDARVADPGDSVAFVGMVLLVLGHDFSVIVDVQLMRVLRKRRSTHREQPNSQTDRAEISYFH
jgi:hypothetical protein